MHEGTINTIIQAIPLLKGIYLFGSRATAESSLHSDWDIAFLKEESSIDTLEKWDLQKKLELLLNADVDLVDLQNSSTVFRFEIISQGLRIWSSDDMYCDIFEMLSFSRYQRFQLERKEILEEIQKTKTVYG